MNITELIGTHDILFVTLDTLRYDVACHALEAGLTPNLEKVLPGGLDDFTEALQAEDRRRALEE